MYPANQKNPTRRNGRVRSARILKPPRRGDYGDIDLFLERVAELNPQLKHTQFADYHGHGGFSRRV